VPCPFSGPNKLCQSGTCYNNGKDDRGTCVVSAKAKTFGQSCITSNECVGVNANNQTFYSECQCGYNPNGLKYCNSFTGDESGELFMKEVKPLYSLGFMNQCHTLLRFSTQCLDMVSSLAGKNSNIYYNSLLNFTNYPLYKDNDPCVKTVYNYAFWSRLGPIPPPPPPDPDDHDDSSYARVLVAMGFLAYFF